MIGVLRFDSRSGAAITIPSSRYSSYLLNGRTPVVIPESVRKSCGVIPPAATTVTIDTMSGTPENPPIDAAAPASASTRDRILDAFAQLLGENGERAATLDAVAAAAGVSKGGCSTTSDRRRP